MSINYLFFSIKLQKIMSSSESVMSLMSSNCARSSTQRHRGIHKLFTSRLDWISSKLCLG